MTRIENMVLSTRRDLLMEKVIDRETNVFQENVYMIYHPDGYGGILSIDERLATLLRSFDGVNSFSNLLRVSSLTEEEKEEAIQGVQYLFEKGFLCVEGEKTVVKKEAWKKELTCWLHITNDCNLRCTYCYIHKTHENMPDETIYQAIDKMLASCKKHHYETLSLMLVGGEPLTRFETIKKIVAYCSEKRGEIQVKYVIPTNGTLLRPEVADYIVSHNISVGVSIDGIAEYHDKNRIKADGTGSYHNAMKGIDNLIAKGLKPSIMVTVTPENIEGLPALTRLMIDKQLFFRYSFERDTQTGHPAILQDIEHCVSVLEECFSIMKQSLLEGKLGWRFQFGDVTFGRPCRRACAAGRNFFAIGQDGSIGSCSLGLECPKTNLSKIDDIITDVESIFAEIGHTSACDVEECKQCLWRHSCAGACPLQTYATYKTFLHTSPYCELYKTCLPEVVRIYAMTIYFNNKKREA